MKVLDPQAALLPTAEVHQFLKSSKPQPKDKKIGAYRSVNLHNYNVVKQDLETYLQGTTPYVLRQPPAEEWMKSLVTKLKNYELTKTEVFALVNLGVGSNESTSAEPLAEVNGQQSADGAADMSGDAEVNGSGEEEGAAESSLDRLLFGLVVEEADERFAGDNGEQRITEIIQIMKDVFTHGPSSNGDTTMNGS